MEQQRRNGARLKFAAIALLALVTFSPDAYAKKTHPPETTPTTPGSSSSGLQQAQLAQLRGTMALAQVRCAKAGMAEESFPGDTKQHLGDLYAREEASTKDGLNKLRDANGDAAKVAAAVAIIDAAPTGVRQYLGANPTVNDTLTRRMKIINAELAMIAQSPDRYVSTLSSIGVTDPSLTSAKSIVRTAANRSGGKVDGDTTGDVLAARSQVRSMLSSRQAKALDAAMSGGLQTGTAPETPTSSRKRKGGT